MLKKERTGEDREENGRRGKEEGRTERGGRTFHHCIVHNLTICFKYNMIIKTAASI